MGLLTEDQKQDMLLVHRRLFQAVCDECEKLIRSGALFVVLKYHKQKWEGPGPKPFNWNKRIPKKVRCMDCENTLMIDVYAKYTKKKSKLSKKGRKLVTPEEAAKIDPIIKKLAARILKKSEEPIPSAIFKAKLFTKAKRQNPKTKKALVNVTLRYLRKAKELICKNRQWSLPKV